jgi:predicted transposase/invertase (TIGR01784 family)
MNPFNDHAFKVIFGCDKNKSLLIDFLNNLFKGEHEIVDVQYLDKEQIPNRKDSRSAIYDIYCKEKNGDFFIVEMQNGYQQNFVKRMVYYTSHSIANQGEIGDDWKYGLKTVYNIAFLNFDTGDLGDELVVRASICDEATGKQLTDVLRFVFIQLPLFNKTVEQCGNFFDRWIYVLKNMYVLENLPKAFQCEAFRKLKEVSDVSKLSGTELSSYEKAQRDYWDVISALDGAEEIGMKKGLEQGRAEGAKDEKYQIVKSMKMRNFSIDVIADITGLSKNEIEKL